MNLRHALAGLLALALASPAAAQVSTTLPVKNGAGSTVNIAGQTDVSGAFHYRDVMEGLTVGGVPTPVLTDASGIVQIATVNPSTVFAGQLKIATTGTRVCLSSQVLVNGVIIKALATNSANGVVGGTTVTNTQDGTGNGYIIQPGEAAPAATNQASSVCVNGTAGDVYTYIGN